MHLRMAAYVLGAPPLHLRERPFRADCRHWYWWRQPYTIDVPTQFLRYGRKRPFVILALSAIDHVPYYLRRVAVEIFPQLKWFGVDRPW